MILNNEIQEIKWKPTVFQLADCFNKKGANCDCILNLMNYSISQC